MPPTNCPTAALSEVVPPFNIGRCRASASRNALRLSPGPLGLTVKVSPTAGAPVMVTVQPLCVISIGEPVNGTSGPPSIEYVDALVNLICTGEVTSPAASAIAAAEISPVPS